MLLSSTVKYLAERINTNWVDEQRPKIELAVRRNLDSSCHRKLFSRHICCRWLLRLNWTHIQDRKKWNCHKTLSLITQRVNKVRLLCTFFVFEAMAFISAFILFKTRRELRSDLANERQDSRAITEWIFLLRFWWHGIYERVSSWRKHRRMFSVNVAVERWINLQKRRLSGDNESKNHCNKRVRSMLDRLSANIDVDDAIISWNRQGSKIFALCCGFAIIWFLTFMLWDFPT